VRAGCRILPRADRDIEAQADYLDREARLETARRFHDGLDVTLEKLDRKHALGE
jgi:hypothetical protein